MANDISGALASFRAFEEPRHGVGTNPFKLGCSLADPAPHDEIEKTWRGDVPTELRWLWLTSRTVRLFEDVEYGQWGLVLLSPEQAAARTIEFYDTYPDDAVRGDIVIGEFLGDLELLVLSGDGEGVLVALPLDPRAHWYRVAPSLTEFLIKYRTALGSKYWEGVAPA